MKIENKITVNIKLEPTTYYEQGDKFLFIMAELYTEVVLVRIRSSEIMPISVKTWNRYMDKPLPGTKFTLEELEEEVNKCSGFNDKIEIIPLPS